MNSNTLETISKSVDEAVDRYKHKFRKVEKHKSEGGVVLLSISLIKKIIEDFDEFLDPKILPLN